MMALAALSHTCLLTILLAGAGTLTVPALAADRKPLPVPRAPTEMTFQAVRGVQYCEVWLLVGNPDTTLSADAYNTTGFNNSANQKNTCPPHRWAQVSTEALQAEYDIYTVFKNGPRGWTMDSYQRLAGPIQRFAGLKTRWYGKVALPLEPYTPLQSPGPLSMTFQKGKPVFILEEKEGTPWVMQSFGRSIDPTLTYDALKTLGDKLKPAAGWKYRVAVLKKDLTITIPQGKAWILQDEFGNLYEACKEGSCNDPP